MKSLLYFCIFIGIILIGIWLLWNDYFAFKYGYSLYAIPSVRSCSSDDDCRGFGNSCVNTSFQPKKQQIISSAFPLWKFHQDFWCECKDFVLINMCEKQ